MHATLQWKGVHKRMWYLPENMSWMEHQYTNIPRTMYNCFFLSFVYIILVKYVRKGVVYIYTCIRLHLDTAREYLLLRSFFKLVWVLTSCIHLSV